MPLLSPGIEASQDRMQRPEDSFSKRTQSVAEIIFKGAGPLLNILKASLQKGITQNAFPARD